MPAGNQQAIAHVQNLSRVFRLHMQGQNQPNTAGFPDAVQIIGEHPDAVFFFIPQRNHRNPFFCHHHSPIVIFHHYSTGRPVAQGAFFAHICHCVFSVLEYDNPMLPSGGLENGDYPFPIGNTGSAAAGGKSPAHVPLQAARPGHCQQRYPVPAGTGRSGKTWRIPGASLWDAGPLHPAAQHAAISCYRHGK